MFLYWKSKNVLMKSLDWQWFDSFRSFVSIISNVFRAKVRATLVSAVSRNKLTFQHFQYRVFFLSHHSQRDHKLRLVITLIICFNGERFPYRACNKVHANKRLFFIYISRVVFLSVGLQAFLCSSLQRVRSAYTLLNWFYTKKDT